MVLNVLFEDRMEVLSTDSSKFEKVLRIRGKSTAYDAEIVLDINSELFPVADKENLYICISKEIIGKRPEDKRERHTQTPHLEDYDYCMYGKIFKMDERSSERRTIYASFGGLIMALTADKQVLSDLELDMRVYLLAKQVGGTFFV